MAKPRAASAAIISIWGRASDAVVATRSQTGDDHGARFGESAFGRGGQDRVSSDLDGSRPICAVICDGDPNLIAAVRTISEVDRRTAMDDRDRVPAL